MQEIPPPTVDSAPWPPRPLLWQLGSFCKLLGIRHDRKAPPVAVPLFATPTYIAANTQTHTRLTHTLSHTGRYTYTTHAHAKQAKCKATHACEECADNWKLVRTSSSSQATRYPVKLAYFKCSNWISLVTNWTGNASLLHSESQLKLNTWLKTLIRQKR